MATARTLRHLVGVRVAPLRRWGRRLRRPVPLGLLLRRGPVSRAWGFDRGTPVDRHFIEGFVAASAADIRGRVLEVKDSYYTGKYGSGVTQADVLDVDAGNPHATIIADLAAAESIPDDTLDCFILTQTLHLIFDVQAAIAECHRILRPGGTLIATMPSASRSSRELRHIDFWRVTPAAAERLFGDVFGPGQVEVIGHGNAVLCAAFLMGVAAEEVPKRRFAHDDPLFSLIVTIRAVKA